MSHPEDRCQRCGGPNVVWFAPSPLWNKAVREKGEPEILCPICFIRLVENLGMSAVWEIAPDDYYLKPEEYADKLGIVGGYRNRVKRRLRI